MDCYKELKELAAASGILCLDGRAGAAKIVASLLIGTEGHLAREFVREHPWAGDLVDRALNSPRTPAGRQRAYRARATLVAIYWGGPDADRYADLFLPKEQVERLCGWCPLPFTPTRWARQKYCCDGCRVARNRFWRKERALAKDDRRVISALLSPDTRARMWVAVARTMRYRNTRRRNAAAKAQIARGLPDW